MGINFYNISNAQNYDADFIPIKNNIENQTLNFSVKSLNTYNEAMSSYSGGTKCRLKK